MGVIFFMQKKIILVDGNNIINRAFYAVPLLSNNMGEFTNAVYGFLNIILKLYQDEKPSHSIIAFDTPKLTFRHEVFDEYKTNRKESPNELKSQFITLKNLLKAMQICFCEKEGFEADDLLGTLAIKFLDLDFDVIIFSGDTDLLQIADKKIKIYVPKNKKNQKQTLTEIYDYDSVVEKYGITPREFIDFKALKGDKSDNVPGICGIGEKNALKIIKEYKSIENAIIELKKKKKRNLTLQEKNLIENEDKALFYKKLIAINKNVGIEISEQQAELKNIFNDDCLKELHRLNLNSIIARVNNF